MASKGPFITGTDGSDYLHRTKIASHYKKSVINKKRLYWCLLIHIILLILMIIKLIPIILELFDCFILEIEELEIPEVCIFTVLFMILLQPLLWEYLWTFGSLYLPFGFLAIQKNKVLFLRIFEIGIFLFSLLSSVWALIFYFKDVFIYISSEKSSTVLLWRGLPYGLVWYAFLFPCVQVHGFSLYFSEQLIGAWKSTHFSKKIQN